MTGRPGQRAGKDAPPRVRRIAIYTCAPRAPEVARYTLKAARYRAACEAFLRGGTTPGFILVEDAYEDRSEGRTSAAMPSLPAFQRLLADVRRQCVEAVVSITVHRAEEEVEDLVQSLQLLVDADAELFMIALFEGDGDGTGGDGDVDRVLRTLEGLH